MSRINTNNCVCHSEHSEESREGKGKEIHRSALNDKLVVNGYAWYTVSERKFRKWAQINANNCVCHSERPLCHSERSEESRGEKERDSSLTL